VDGSRHRFAGRPSNTAERRGVLRAIFWGGLACGTCDTIAALVVYNALGTRPSVLLHFIASGALGMRSFSGGPATAVLGLVFEFVISFGAAAVFVTASRWWPWLAQRPEFSGPLYGVAVYFFMNLVVVAHSAAPKQPFSLKLTIVGLIIHMLCVGSPIAFVAHRFARVPAPLAA